MNSEERLILNKFSPRSYQLPLFDAIENKGYKRVLAILPRRAGKDICAWNLMIRAALRRIAVYYYIFPTYAQAKKVIWNSITNQGESFLDYIPASLVKSKNSQEMKILLANGSIIQLVGSDNVDSLVGTNPYGVVFSEYALQDPKAYQFLRPVLVANDGWMLFISTPRGKNHLYDILQIAQNNPAWFCYVRSVNETQHISLHEIEKERAEGLMSDDLIQQEYFCSFDLGIEGSYYSKYIDKMRLDSRIGNVPHEVGFKVHTAWDLGMRDSTTIIFFQTIGTTVRIIDCYENSKVGLEHYISVVGNKGFIYGKHIAPHDIKVRELGTGLSRLEKARSLGISFIVAPDLSIMDGIEAVRTAFSKIWIDETKCAPLLKALENYRQEYDLRNKTYKSNPLHNWSSHFCFTGDTPILTRNGIRQIMNIENNDEVLTLEGWKKCTKAIKTRLSANLVEVSFEDGMKVKCTPDHLFLTETGWISAELLIPCTKIQSHLTHSHNIIMDTYIGYGLQRSISPKEELPYTEAFGDLHSELSHKIVIYITKIAIPLITICGTLSVLILRSISGFLGQMERDLVIKQETLLLLGIHQRRVGYGILGMLSDLNLGQSGRERSGNAYFVKKNSTVSLGKMDIIKSSATTTAKHLIIESVKYLEVKEDVWDITVPYVGHFSLSNGAIVHNSDAMRYLCISLSKTRDGLSPEDLDKRYMDAMLGQHSGMPSVFRDDLPNY